MQTFKCPICGFASSSQELDSAAARAWRAQVTQTHVYAVHIPELPSHQRRMMLALRSEAAVALMGSAANSVDTPSLAA